MGKRWNEHEKFLLRNYYGKITAKKISIIYLKNRSERQIFDYAQKLGLSSDLKVISHSKKIKKKISESRRRYYGTLNESEDDKRRRKNAYKKDWGLKNINCRREKNLRYKKKYPKKVNAMNLAEKYIQISENQLCEVCNDNEAEHRHHPDYNFPLKVNFLCIPCHNEIHRSIKSTQI